MKKIKLTEILEKSFFPNFLLFKEFDEQIAKDIYYYIGA